MISGTTSLNQPVDSKQGLLSGPGGGGRNLGSRGVSPGPGLIGGLEDLSMLM